jgi:hypothetical protein
MTKKKQRDLALRLKKLLDLGLKLTQVAGVAGISYSSLHRFLYAQDIALTEETRATVHANLDTWVKKLGAA